MVELSNRLTTAAITHPRLAPFLMDGLDNAQETLLLCDRESELQPVQQWLLLEIGKNLRADSSILKN